jgi:hypothetical protein
LQKSSSPVGCRFFGRSGGGIDVRITGAFGVRLFLHWVSVDVVVGHCLCGRYGRNVRKLRVSVDLISEFELCQSRG